ncbi:hypothetical protein ABID08_003135 [Rhizobium binae]|uniref:Uncharacterized protein n=1 Tax=Rhizobium binae TaxID=1138190 RepID=A0ABV2MHZ6_9HYPH
MLMISDQSAVGRAGNALHRQGQRPHAFRATVDQIAKMDAISSARRDEVKFPRNSGMHLFQQIGASMNVTYRANSGRFIDFADGGHPF